uniref:AsmA family protein n=1 Tax=Sphingopyxis macrogoltabida TaxID=33050 RepID=A9ZM04_SPHMC|nr:AsmA family protein [Sphingopyxis macrogoltabida]
MRDADGRSNWGGPRPGGSDSSPPPAIGTVRINEGRFTLKDAKRRLDIAGTIEAKDAKGLAIAAEGQFNGAAAKLGAAASWAQDAKGRWPFSAELTSDLLRLSASGTMAAPLDTAHMTMRMTAHGTSLKQLDYIIEAGLFGTQAIDLDGAVRRDGTDWFIDRLDGRIGRSTIAATAKILKRGGRTRIDASIDAPRLDFDDLADDAGLAAARAQQARIGPRIFPDTRINLAKMGPTDGVIRITIHQLLVKGGSVFKSLKGQLSLDHRILTLDKAVAQLGRGTMSGRVKVDSRGKIPLLTTELRIDGASFDDFCRSARHDPRPRARAGSDFGTRRHRPPGLRFGEREDRVRCQWRRNEPRCGLCDGAGSWRSDRTETRRRRGNDTDPVRDPRLLGQGRAADARPAGHRHHHRPGARARPDKPRW